MTSRHFVLVVVDYNSVYYDSPVGLIGIIVEIDMDVLGAWWEYCAIVDKCLNRKELAA